MSYSKVLFVVAKCDIYYLCATNACDYTNGMMTELDDVLDDFHFVVCKTKELEQQNAALVEALKDLDTRIMPEERKYDEWDYCRIHKDILYGFDAIVKQAIALVEGEQND